MLAGISGQVTAVEDNALVVQCGLFRIRVACPLPLLAHAAVGGKVDLHTHLHVREDDLSLFGFADEADLRLFRLLISVSGIGPKGALEILAAGGDAVRQALQSEDVAFLTGIKGIGKRTAERAIIELREKIEHAAPATAPRQHPQSSARDEAVAALEGLGWKKSQIDQRLKQAPEDLCDTEALIRWFLTNS